MKLIHFFIFITLCAYSAARTLPFSFPQIYNISNVSVGSKQLDWPDSWDNASTGVDTPPTSPGPKPDNPHGDAIWCKALGRGRMLAKAMMLNQEEASLLLQWPYIQSPWDGPLHNELRRWGYLDSEEMHRKVDPSCDFTDMAAAFAAMGVSTKSTGKGGQNQCFLFTHANGPAMKRDKDGKLPDVSKQDYLVDKVRYPATNAYYKMGANPTDGLIYFLERKSPQSGLQETRHVGQESFNKLPRLRSSSDIAWGMWNRVTSARNIKNVKKFISVDVINEDTEYIIQRILWNLGQEDPKIWPGNDFEISFEDGREAETEAALALLGSPNGIAVGYFLTQHKRQLGTKFVWKVKIFSSNSDWDLPHLLFYVDEAVTAKKPEDADGPGSKEPGKPKKRRDSGVA